MYTKQNNTYAIGYLMFRLNSVYNDDKTKNYKIEIPTHGK